MQATLLNDKTIPVGETTSNIINVPGTVRAKTVTFTLDARNYVAGTTLDVAIMASFDGGQTWQMLFGFGVTERGTNLDGSPGTSWGATMENAIALPAFQARAIATVKGNPVRTTITASVE